MVRTSSLVAIELTAEQAQLLLAFFDQAPSFGAHSEELAPIRKAIREAAEGRVGAEPPIDATRLVPAGVPTRLDISEGM